MKKQETKTKGRVIEELPNQMLRVEIPDETQPTHDDVAYRSIICYLSGKMRINKIRVNVGDRVEVVVDPYGGKATNRITRRL